jgi:hypothetical protein
MERGAKTADSVRGLLEKACGTLSKLDAVEFARVSVDEAVRA